MTELQNRTLICSVLFLDIVEYSRKAVAEQIALRDRLNTLLSEALRGVALNDRIILDTGDGAAVSFIGDPEDALFVATALRDAIQARPDAGLSTRMGINLGPVRLVKDINGRPNVIGDGINVAQRIMTFADPGQVLVSRSYYEVVSRLSEETSKLFSYEGARTDKHIREHEVYAVGAVQPARRHAEPEAVARKDTEAPRGAALTWMAGILRTLTRSIAGRPPVATGIAVAAILMVAFVVRASREPPEAPIAAAPAAPEQASVEPVKPASAPKAQSRADTTPPAPPKAQTKAEAATPAPPKAQAKAQAATPAPPKAQTKAEAAPSAPPARTALAQSEDKPGSKPQAAPGAPARTAREKERAAQRPDDAPTKVAASSATKPATGSTANESRREAASEPKVAAAAAPATLALAVAPWGEVHIDGKMQGVSPPLQEVQLAPGKHRIELRNSGARAHVVTVDAKPGERIRIKHKFK